VLLVRDLSDQRLAGFRAFGRLDLGQRTVGVNPGEIERAPGQPHDQGDAILFKDQAGDSSEANFRARL
jgi:hypothetical protein